MHRLRNPGQRGFTLVEIAIVLVVIGLLVSGGLALFSPMVESSRSKLTLQRMELAAEGLTAHFGTSYALDSLDTTSEYDRHVPCPANPALIGQVGEGVADPTLCDGSGILPWVTLGLPVDAALDGWGRYLTYQARPSSSAINIEVAQYLNATDTAPVQSNIAAITITPPPTDQRILHPEFILVSHGRNGVGSYRDLGARYRDCTALLPAERANCDNVSRLYAVAPHSDNPDTGFDDQLLWRVRGQMITASGAIISAINPNAWGGGNNDGKDDSDDNDNGGGNDDCNTPPCNPPNNGGGNNNQRQRPGTSRRPSRRQPLKSVRHVHS